MIQGKLEVAPSPSFTDVLSRLIELIDEIALVTEDSVIGPKILSDFAAYLKKIIPILVELKDDKEMDTQPIRKALESLEKDLKKAQGLAILCKSGSRFYLWFNFSAIVNQLKDLTHDLGRCLSLILMASLDVSNEIKNKIGNSHKEMLNAKFNQLFDDKEFIEEMIEGIKSGRFNKIDAEEFLVTIAQDVDVLPEPAMLRQEIENLKKNADAPVHKGQIEAMDLRRIIEFLEQADLLKDKNFNSLGSPDRNSTVSLHSSDGLQEKKFHGGLDEIFLIIRDGRNEDLSLALSELHKLIEGSLLDEERVRVEDLIPILAKRLSSKKQDIRKMILVILRILVSKNDDNKERLADDGALTLVVRSLTRDAEERREAVGLLLELSDVSRVRQRIGRVQGCILLVVAMLNSDDPCAVLDTKRLLDILSSNTQHVLHMAEANYFKPLVQCLREGSDMNRVLMATAISRMELTNQSKAALGEEGSIEPLVKLFISGKLEAKLAALGALQNLSTLTSNARRLIDSAIVGPILQLLFSVTSVLMTLREPAAAILANISESEQVLTNHHVTEQILSLLSLSSPTVQYHLFRALTNITSHPSASKLRSKMRENDSAEELNNQLGEGNLKTIVNIALVSGCVDEKAAALGIVSNIPITDRKATDVLVKAHLLPYMITLIKTESMNTLLVERAVSTLVRFTVPWDKKLQREAAKLGAIPLLVKVLSSGSCVAKARAATALAQLSQNSLSLSNSKANMWSCIGSSSIERECKVHGGTCSVKGSLCLIKAGAIPLLVRVLEGREREADEAVLGALSTLLQDKTWEKGCQTIAEASGVQPIIEILRVGSLKAQEKAVWILERIFRIEEYRVEYGDPVQVLFIDLAQKGDPAMKSLTAKILAHLELLQNQSSYF
ncbi:U-box domain-containing protein 44 isoform X2 [Amborella trichopoda]|uniref:U-box domain-containing protein 44 isoform X2 n=1 Tax=Amborella trichopoda TaxID=13333 RepID=UPI0005D30EBC|nr:U-box domain-containing protein 44 isoform X2 [Amborella trichopoda]|eukprot:XP_011622950.1 U-box domain-containing protein 44 isoform X2 [Amborella trichopoda]